MKKLIYLLTLVLFAFAVTPMFAANPKSPADYNGLNKGKSDTHHLYLYEKDSNWDIIEDGAWGKMNFKVGEEMTTFVFNGHMLEPGMEYSLINYAPGTDWSVEPYPQPWPGVDSILLGTATANNGGEVHIKGEVEGISGKVWLVLSEDFEDGTGMIGWHPAEYLFEYDLVD